MLSLALQPHRRLSAEAGVHGPTGVGPGIPCESWASHPELREEPEPLVLSPTEMKEITMRPGMHTTKDGEVVLVQLTTDGRYMIRYADGRVTVL